MKKLLFAILCTCLFVMPVAAHGTEITYSAIGETITISALFDDQEPMAEAQIVAYAPNNPEVAYHTGTADANGQYTFDIDTSIAGSWDITVRVASHGEIIHVPVQGGKIVPQASSFLGGGTFRTIATVFVLAALAGVAYYFSRKPKLATSR